MTPAGQRGHSSEYHCTGYLRMCVFFLVLATLLSAGCATVGRDFPDRRVSEIELNATTQDEIRAMFGPPWRTGIEDGQPTWTYGIYRYRLLGQTSTKDLVIRFNRQGIVTSYTFNTTEHSH